MHVFASENNVILRGLLNDRFTTTYTDCCLRTTSDFVDLYISGFPCPPHSAMGKLLRGRDCRARPQRAVEAYIRDVCPRSFILENVTNIARGRGARQWKSFIRRLRSCHYHVFEADLNSNAHGVVQSRPRRYVVGLLESLKHADAFTWPTPRSPMHVLDAVMDAASLNPWLSSSQMPNSSTTRRNMAHAQAVLEKEPLGVLAVSDLRASRQRMRCTPRASCCLTKTNAEAFGLWWVKAEMGGFRWKRMSVCEMGRLQGWPDSMIHWFHAKLPDRAFAGALGNGFTYTTMHSILCQLIPLL